MRPRRPATGSIGARSGVRRSDFPIREVIAELQDDAIAELFSPVNLARVGDQELKVRKPGDTMTLADLFAWTNAAIFDDLGPRLDRSAAPRAAAPLRRLADGDRRAAVGRTPTSSTCRARRSRWPATTSCGSRHASTAASGPRATRERARIWSTCEARVDGILQAHNVRSI